jgi:hypothetical protein
VGSAPAAAAAAGTATAAKLLLSLLLSPMLLLSMRLMFAGADNSVTLLLVAESCAPVAASATVPVVACLTSLLLVVAVLPLFFSLSLVTAGTLSSLLRDGSLSGKTLLCTGTATAVAGAAAVVLCSLSGEKPMGESLRDAIAAAALLCLLSTGVAGSRAAVLSSWALVLLVLLGNSSAQVMFVIVQ